jgi:hypothetical protein
LISIERFYNSRKKKLVNIFRWKFAAARTGTPAPRATSAAAPARSDKKKMTQSQETFAQLDSERAV